MIDYQTIKALAKSQQASYKADRKGERVMDKNKGMKVRLWHNLTGQTTLETLRNVTEIHYNYRRRSERAGEVMVAFESDVHGTGGTYRLASIVEFEAVSETEIAESF